MARDLTVFADSCQKFGQPVSIRGSSAYVLSRERDSESIAESVPPLGDLDIVVRGSPPAESMRRIGDVLEHFRTYVPASRFIHVDVFYEDLPVRGDSPLGNVNINGLPNVTIGVGEQQGDRWTPKRSSLDLQAKADVTLKVRATLFRDFLFLLRLSQRHPELSKATGEVATLLNDEAPNALGLSTRHEGGVRELARIDKALAKHVLMRGPKQEFKPIAEYLSVDWLFRFASHLNPLSRRIILSEETWKRIPAIAYAVEGRVIRFAEVTDLEPEERNALDEKLAAGEDLEAQRLTPSLKVALPNPDDHGCCEYRDFSRGISELAFRDPDGSSLLNLALLEGREQLYGVHALAGKGFGALSLRTDAGFMGMLNHGSLGAVRVMGVRRRK